MTAAAAAAAVVPLINQSLAAGLFDTCTVSRVFLKTNLRR